jgi:hypothetical protein
MDPNEPATIVSEVVCMWCGERILAGEERAPLGGTWHRDCAIRMILGSVGHLEGRCSCFRRNESNCDDDDPPGDPPGMSRREAARAAVARATELGKLGRWP